jgi:hypothetical protein
LGQIVGHQRALGAQVEQLERDSADELLVLGQRLSKADVSKRTKARKSEEGGGANVELSGDGGGVVAAALKAHPRHDALTSQSVR